MDKAAHKTDRSAFFQKYGLIMLIIAIGLFRQFIASHLPIRALAEMTLDDQWMVKMANNLLRFKWLGDYGSDTLIKGCGFPFFLALMNILGISYLDALALFYTFACAFFIYALQPILKKWQRAFLFCFLSLNPACFSVDIFQSVHRSSLGPAFSLIVSGGLIAVYLRLDQSLKRLIFWSVFTGINLAWMWNTREDSIWIIPFVISATIISTIMIFKK